jgi:hypothetical protein
MSTFSPEALAETIDSLASDETVRSLEADPYWPKWDGPWWRMVLLHELGIAGAIPKRAVETLTRSLTASWLPFFPLTLAEVPAGKDPVRSVACHCALGCIYQVLTATGVAVDREIPWIRPWFLRYQLPDGGLNCDEAAYTRPVPRSSVVSTLPALEAILYAAPRPLSDAEVSFLDRGARYLIERRLLRSVSGGGKLMDESWLRPTFPRFYDYDLLRGLAWLVRWARELGRELPEEAVRESVAALEKLAPTGGLVAVGQRAWEPVKTRFLENGAWKSGAPARTFKLLDEVSVVGNMSVWLTRSWFETSRGLAGLRAEGRLARGGR